jgi:hypothetical protein
LLLSGPLSTKELKVSARDDRLYAIIEEPPNQYIELIDLVFFTDGFECGDTSAWSSTQ